MKQFTLTESWDVVFFMMLLPVVVLMGSELPADWAHHQGRTLPATATVRSLEPFRGGERVLVDVRTASSQVVATSHEVDGGAPHNVGASFPVRYLPTSSTGSTRVYASGYDPFDVNVTVFVPLLLFWLTTVAFVAARIVRVGRRVFARLQHRRRRRLTGPYRAGQGYTSE